MKTRKKTKGFTLLEVLVAMMLLGVAAAGVGLPFASAASVQREASVQAAAAKLASDKLAQLRAAGAAALADSTEAQGQVRRADGSVFADAFYAGFGRTVTCQTAQVGGVDLTWVTVAVSHGGREVVRISTLIGD